MLPPGRQVHLGGASSCSAVKMVPLASEHLAPSLLVTAVMVMPGGVTQSKVLMYPMELVLII